MLPICVGGGWGALTDGEGVTVPGGASRFARTIVAIIAAFVCAAGTGPASQASTQALTAPGAPGTPTGAASNRSVNISWTAPAANGGSAITGYTVTASPGGRQCTTTGGLSCIIDQLTNGTAYTFTVTATNSVGTGPASQPSAPVTPQVSSSPLTVSLTFDDGYDSMYTQALPLLTSHGMHGTFFINSGVIGTASFMTWSQVDALFAGGNEIGGHTIDHANLPTITLAQVRTEVCADRNTLLSHGYAVTDFAYPFGQYNTDIEGIVQLCGYNSARTTDWIDDICDAPCTESIPPRNPYATAIIAYGEDDVTLSKIEQQITTAEAYGGWAQIMIHRVCNPTTDPNCFTPRMTIPDFTAMLDWLANEVAQGRVKIQTVAQVIGGPVNPPVDPNSPTVPGAPGTPTGVAGNGSVTVSWTAPGSNGGASITGYTVTAAPGGATCTTTGALSCTVSGLINGTAYTFTVTATNSVGTGPASQSSAAVTPQALTAPGAPGTPTGVAGNGSVTVSWTAPGSNGGAR